MEGLSMCSHALPALCTDLLRFVMSSFSVDVRQHQLSVPAVDITTMLLDLRLLEFMYQSLCSIQVSYKAFVYANKLRYEVGISTASSTSSKLR